MAKDLKEQIQIMTHYLNGGKIEVCFLGSHNWSDLTTKDYLFDFRAYIYRIKEQKKTVIIEKWLMKAGDKKSFFIANGDKSYLENYHSQTEKVKLLETYEVEL